MLIFRNKKDVELRMRKQNSTLRKMLNEVPIKNPNPAKIPMFAVTKIAPAIVPRNVPAQ